MTEIFCGCSDLPRDRRAFYQTATAIEHRVGMFTPPKAKVLKSWAEAASGAKSPMRTIWTAWQAFTHRPADIKKGFGVRLLPGESASNLGYFQKTPENIRIWKHILEQAHNVGASRILLETPAGFTPSEVNKRALSDFATNWADIPDGMRLVWHPAGFWQREETAELTQNLGMVLAIDPLVDEKDGLPDCGEIYFQMLGRHGLLDTYSDDDTEYILDAAAQFDDCTIIFRTRDSLGDARRLIKCAETYVPNDEFSFDDEEFDEDEFEEDGEDIE